MVSQAPGLQFYNQTCTRKNKYQSRSIIKKKSNRCHKRQQKHCILKQVEIQQTEASVVLFKEDKMTQDT